MEICWVIRQKILGHLHTKVNWKIHNEILLFNLVALSEDVEIFEQVLHRCNNINGQKIAIQVAVT